MASGCFDLKIRMDYLSVLPTISYIVMRCVGRTLDLFQWFKPEFLAGKVGNINRLDTSLCCSPSVCD